MAKKVTTQSNTSSDLWLEAFTVYVADKGVIDRAQGTLRKHQLAYENQGVSAKQVRARYAESELTEDERMALYADEQRSRRALDLWSAESPEEFEQLIERAAQTEPASREAFDKLSAVRAYSDGNNSGRLGGSGVDDNPHVPGSAEHQQWALGWADGVDEDVRVAATEMPQEDHQNADGAGQLDEPTIPAAIRKAKRKKPTELLAENAAKFDAEPEPIVDGLFPEMLTPPGLPN